MNGHIAVAIDGPSGAGKSSLARRCAKDFGLIYVDTGAIYRTVGLAALREGVNRRDEEAVAALLPRLRIEMRYNDAGEQRMFRNGEDGSGEIRLPEVSLCASDVSALPAVRAYLLEMQRRMAREHDVIMDGRDIGTVVLPEAELKIFLSASAEARAERRLKELREKGVKAEFDAVLRDIEYRDAQDTTRAAAPLRAAEDAVPLDTTALDFEQSAAAVAALLRERCGLEAKA